MGRHSRLAAQFQPVLEAQQGSVPAHGLITMLGPNSGSRVRGWLCVMNGRLT